MPTQTVASATDQELDGLGADFGNRLAAARKARSLSQDEVGKRAGVRGTMVGRYERAEASPSVAIAARLARAVGTSLDYLTGVRDADLDPDTAKRILAVQDLPDAEQQHVYALLDAFVAKSRIQGILT